MKLHGDLLPIAVTSSSCASSLPCCTYVLTTATRRVCALPAAFRPPFSLSPSLPPSRFFLLNPPLSSRSSPVRHLRPVRVRSDCWGRSDTVSQVSCANRCLASLGPRKGRPGRTAAKVQSRGERMRRRRRRGNGCESSEPREANEEEEEEEREG
eukprot:177725-Hanusia_phi.AAC.5